MNGVIRFAKKHSTYQRLAASLGIMREGNDQAYIIQSSQPDTCNFAATNFLYMSIPATLPLC